MRVRGCTRLLWSSRYAEFDGMRVHSRMFWSSRYHGTGLNHIVRRQKIYDTKKSSFDTPKVPNDAECSYTPSESKTFGKGVLLAQLCLVDCFGNPETLNCIVRLSCI